jgi:hypothetical protein
VHSHDQKEHPMRAAGTDFDDDLRLVTLPDGEHRN